MKITLKPKSKDMGRFLGLCLVCCLLWYALSMTAAVVYLVGWKSVINDCGKDYYYSTLIVRSNDYYFDDVAGCKEGKDGFSCIYSIKDSKINNFYSLNHAIDEKTKNYLYSLPKNEVINKSILELSEYLSMKELLDASMVELKQVLFLISYRNDIINKIHIITSKKPNTYCSNAAVKLLEKNG